MAVAALFGSPVFVGAAAPVGWMTTGTVAAVGSVRLPTTLVTAAIVGIGGVGVPPVGVVSITPSNASKASTTTAAPTKDHVAMPRQFRGGLGGANGSSGEPLRAAMFCVGRLSAGNGAL